MVMKIDSLVSLFSNISLPFRAVFDLPLNNSPLVRVSAEEEQSPGKVSFNVESLPGKVREINFRERLTGDPGGVG